MARNHVIRTARLTDRQVLDLMYALKEKLEIVSTHVSPGLGKSIDFQHSKRGNEVIKILDGDSYYIRDSSVSTASGIHYPFFTRYLCRY